MKNLKTMLATLIMLFVIFSSCVAFASEDYILRKELAYTNEHNYELQKGFVEIMIGQKDFTDYQDDDYIKITPAPDEIKEDEYGNIYAYYDVTGYKPGRTLKVTVERKFEVKTYEEEISVRSDSTADEESKLFVEPQLRVDSDDAKIIALAKELTDGISSDYKKAQAIFEYVNTNLEYNTSSNYANKGSISALETKKGVCEEFATLYAALCRAVDIPCRLVEGFRYEKKLVKESDVVLDNDTGEYVMSEPVYEYEIINHVWNEVYFDDYGWVPVDTCVIYAPGGSRVTYYDSFCKILSEEYVANGIYNYDKANRTMLGVKETSYKEEMFPADSVEIEEHEFLDIDNYSWAEDSINTLYDMGIIKGYTDTEYGPSGNVSRIEFISLLARVLRNMNYQPTEKGLVYYFSDYDKNHYSKEDYDYLMACLEDENPFDQFAKGYYTMVTIFGSSLDINRPITRGEVVALLDPFLKDEVDETAYFPDIIGNRFSASVIKAYSNGLIQGYSDGTFRPNGTITRAEIAVILDRYVGVKDYVI